MMLIVFKLVLALGDGLLGVWVLRNGAFERWAEGPFLGRIAALQVIPAVALFVGLYLIGHQEVTSDVPGYYLPAAHAVLEGKVPFRDFMLSYAPLFPYVGAALVWMWDSGKVFALFSILVNAVALILWHRMASTCLERRTARQSTVLFATSGHLLLQTLLGTNQIWIGAALAASASLIVMERPAASGLLQAVAAGTIKILALLFWPALWICARHRWRWLAAALCPVVALYGIFAAAGGDIFYPLRFEGELITSGNLPYVLDPLLSADAATKKAVSDAVLLVALGATTLWLFLRIRALTPRQRAVALPVALALTGVIFLLVSKKSYTGYAVFVMYPIVATLGIGLQSVRARVGFLLTFNTLLATEPSLWFHLGGFKGTLRQWLAAGGGAAAAGFILVDVALLACYVWVAWVSVGCIRRMTDGAMTSSNASHSATACSLV
jgi:hypothetical protein